jgi:hypothetical protein
VPDVSSRGATAVPTGKEMQQGAELPEERHIPACFSPRDGDGCRVAPKARRFSLRKSAQGQSFDRARRDLPALRADIESWSATIRCCRTVRPVHGPSPECALLHSWPAARAL